MIPYPEYKESSISWIGKIPSHWDIFSIGKLADLGRGRVISNEEIENNKGEYPVYSSQTANNGIMGYLNTYDFDGEYVTWTTDGANAGTVFYRQGKFNCTNVCGTIKPRTANKLYLNYLPYFLNIATRAFVRMDINPKLMNNVMARISVTLPPYEEQLAIANYLDAKTASIDDIIAKKEKLIDLLREERIAIINQAVTKGLNPNAKMKHSGIEWLDDPSTSLRAGIPEHWEVGLVKRYYDVKLGKMLDAKKQNGDGTAKPYLKAANIHWDRVLFNDVSEMKFTPFGHLTKEKLEVLLTIVPLGACLSNGLFRNS